MTGCPVFTRTHLLANKNPGRQTQAKQTLRSPYRGLAFSISWLPVNSTPNSALRLAAIHRNFGNPRLSCDNRWLFEIQNQPCGYFRTFREVASCLAATPTFRAPGHRLAATTEHRSTEIVFSIRVFEYLTITLRRQPNTEEHKRISSLQAPGSCLAALTEHRSTEIASAILCPRHMAVALRPLPSTEASKSLERFLGSLLGLSTQQAESTGEQAFTCPTRNPEA